MAPTPSPSAGAPLMRVSGYDLLEEIARGGMGIVYRARQLDPRRTVALKMLLPHQLGSPEMAERFRLEVRALTELEHPAILPVHQMGEHDGLPFFTMKLATGGTLAQRKAQLAGDWRSIAELMAILGDAVQFAHERGVLHRDLKPGNILFDDQGRPYVSDFGLAKLVSDDSDLTRSVDFLGTPHYVAPEVAIRSARQATTASDIYSLGAIFYELLTGHPPFEAESVVALLKKIAEEEPVPPSRRAAVKVIRNQDSVISETSARRSTTDHWPLITDYSKTVPRDLEVICLKCLAKEPSRRYASARELADELRRWLAGKPISARPITPAARFLKWVKRNPVTFTLSLLLVLAVAGSGFGLARSKVKLEKALAASRSSLRESLLAQARFQRGTGRVGQRFQTIELLGSAARLFPVEQGSKRDWRTCALKPPARSHCRTCASGPAGLCLSLITKRRLLSLLTWNGTRPQRKKAASRSSRRRIGARCAISTVLQTILPFNFALAGMTSGLLPLIKTGTPRFIH
jgi:serine/threonine protein kinase